ncbi:MULTISPECIES: prenyltransferase/squalene oxidase repeat-containing protein [unclassified Streptomyces]|uniref:prenyltransferase/squalene oxidase repeat-containing protein n=1 Tax=unclassified Streptomyces TaxID=2593676 RepID=UPI0003802924|nr:MULTISPECIES: prenyltransferase/squalene oxidase repeat-containing protein [unclassified Streptomyces]
MAPTASQAAAPQPHSAAPRARRAATALAAAATAAVLAGAAAPVAYADGPAAPQPTQQKLPKGLYGTKDPQYDGVWRQSLALVAQHTVGVRPAASAVDWLAGQQCADGAFAAYRPEPGKACDAATMRDTNQTAAAIQALTALGGHGDAVRKAVTWLKSVQHEDGGWSSMPGGQGGEASDANSTAVVIGALAAAGEKPESVTAKGGKSPYDALLSFRLGCDAKEAERGAFTFQLKNAAPNADATAAAVTGALGKGFVVAPAGKDADRPVKAPDCAKDAVRGSGADARTAAADGGASWLVGQLDAGGQHLRSAMPGAEQQPDVGNTADAVVALAAGGHGTAARQPLAWLEKNAGAWAKQNGPAAYAQLILAAHATGADPRAFGGTDLVSALDATGPAPAASAAPSPAADKGTSDGGGIGLWWVIGVGLAVGAGIGFLISGRNKNKNAL